MGQVFSSVAGSYDIMNDLMSGALRSLWSCEHQLAAAPLPPGGAVGHCSNDKGCAAAPAGCRVYQPPRLPLLCPPGPPGGMHRLWKDRLVEKLRPRPGQKHLGGWEQCSCSGSWMSASPAVGRGLTWRACCCPAVTLCCCCCCPPPAAAVHPQLLTALCSRHTACTQMWRAAPVTWRSGY